MRYLAAVVVHSGSSGALARTIPLETLLSNVPFPKSRALSAAAFLLNGILRLDRGGRATAANIDGLNKTAALLKKDLSTLDAGSMVLPGARRQQKLQRTCVCIATVVITGCVSAAVMVQHVFCTSAAETRGRSDMLGALQDVPKLLVHSKAALGYDHKTQLLGSNLRRLICGQSASGSILTKAEDMVAKRRGLSLLARIAQDRFERRSGAFVVSLLAMHSGILDDVTQTTKCLHSLLDVAVRAFLSALECNCAAE
jgi:hypothetical protein